MKKLWDMGINYDKRVYGLDIYRAIAIILVVIGHGKYMLNETPLEGFPWVRILDGVEMFFVLSGFLIGTILLKIITKNDELNGKQLFNFWQRRWFRTLPNYFLILLVNYLFVKIGFIQASMEYFGWDYFFFLQNFNGPVQGFFIESWSLTVEEWFYIVLPLCLSLFLLILKPKQAFLFSIVLLICLPLLYRFYLSPESVNGYWWDVKFRKTVMTRLDTIIYGVLAAWVKFYYPDFWKKIRIPAVIAGLIILVIVINFKPMLGDKADYNHLYLKTIYFTLASIGAMFLLPFADGIKKFKGIIGKAITHASLISYSMYLINLSLVSAIIRLHFEPQGGWDGILKYSLYWIIVLVVSTLIYRFFEKPITDLRDWSKQKSRQ